MPTATQTRPAPARREPRQPPQLPAAAEKLHHYDDAFLDCRDLKHPWQRVGSPYRYGPEIRRQLLCPRCHVMRTDRWTANGTRLGNRYDYTGAEGYRVTEGGASALDVRQEILRRMTVFASEAEMTQAMAANGRTKR